MKIGDYILSIHFLKRYRSWIYVYCVYIWAQTIAHAAFAHLGLDRLPEPNRAPYMYLYFPYSTWYTGFLINIGLNLIKFELKNYPNNLTTNLQFSQ